MKLLETIQAGTLRGLARLMAGAAKGKLIVLMYHRVLPTADPLLSGLPDAQRFDWQMALVHKHFRVFTLSEALNLMRADRLPPQAVCVTFDDGYADNYLVALPILKRWGIRATFFVTTGVLDGGRMWNDTIIEALRRFSGEVLDLSEFGLERFSLGTVAERRTALNAMLARWKYLPFRERQHQVAKFAEWVGASLPDDLMMTSSQVAGLHNEEMEIGAHTVNHPVLATTDNTDAVEEIRQSKLHLEQIVGAPLFSFAYPNGNPDKDYDTRHVKMVRDAGFQAAVSTAWGCASGADDKFQLPRIWPWDRTPFRYGLRMLATYRASPFKFSAELPPR